MPDAKNVRHFSFQRRGIMKNIIDIGAFHNTKMETAAGETAIITSTDVEPILNRNQRLREAGRTKTGMGDHLAAVIPIALLQEFAQKRLGVPNWRLIADDDKLLDEFLNSREYKKTRIYEGAI